MSSFGSIGMRSSSDGSTQGDNLYNYVPTEWVCILFISLYATSQTLHIVQALRYKTWWLFPTAVVACTTEILGWSGRLWSSLSPLDRTPFLIQVSTLIMAPHILLLRTLLLGPQYCRMSMKWYSIAFVAVDTTALIIQAVGGGIASGTKPTLGGHIALVGIVLQLMALLFSAFIAGEFFLRFAYDRPIRHFHDGGVVNRRGEVDRNLGQMILGISTMTTLLVIRSIYRTVELSDGWTGVIISTQWLFNTFDGAMIVLATFTLNALHPGRLL
ncbi:RTA1 like protein-domain-containing protein, partial [Lactarius quietus]